MKKTTQKMFLFAYLVRHKKSWTPMWMFYKMGISCHTARISELRKDGYKIIMKSKSVKHPVFKNQRRTEYKLID